MSGFESFLDECEKSACRLAWDHIEGDEIIVCSNEVLVVRIEGTEVVFAAVVGAVCNFFESASSEPSIDLGSAYWDDVEARLRSAIASSPLAQWMIPSNLLSAGTRRFWRWMRYRYSMGDASQR